MLQIVGDWLCGERFLSCSAIPTPPNNMNLLLGSGLPKDSVYVLVYLGACACGIRRNVCSDQVGSSWVRSAVGPIWLTPGEEFRVRWRMWPLRWAGVWWRQTSGRQFFVLLSRIMTPARPLNGA